MPNKNQFWDYIVTLEIRVSAADREEAKRIIIDDFLSTPRTISNESITIVRVRPTIKK